MSTSIRNNSRANLAISGWICIVIGSGIILSSGPSSIVLAIAHSDFNFRNRPTAGCNRND